MTDVTRAKAPAENQEEVQIPSGFLCPITLELMSDPVMLVDTWATYDRKSIERWFAKGHATCPRTNQEVKNMQLIPNYALKSSIDDWLEQHPEVAADVEESRKEDALADAAEAENAVLMGGQIAAAVEILSTGDDVGKRNAAESLRLLAEEDQFRSGIAKAGAIPPLVDLVRDGAAGGKEAATRALWNLACDNAENKVLIAECGGIEPLVGVLKNGSASTKKLAAGALSNLACDNHDNVLAISHAGVFPPLIELLRTGSPSAKEVAALAVRNLAFTDETVDAITEAGGILPLVELLRSGRSGTEDAAAAALKNLACDNTPNKIAIAKAGAIPLLVKLVKEGRSSSREAAVRAISNLASYSKNKVPKPLNPKP